MRTVIASLTALLVVVIAACGGPPKKKVEDLPTGSANSDTCCCKSTPMTSEDGKPVYEHSNTMECSQHQGDCVPDVQCNGNGNQP